MRSNSSIQTASYVTDKCKRLVFGSHTLHNFPPQSYHRESEQERQGKEKKKRKGENNALVSSPS